jgi:GNAT superfamily N-acetyltransferase
MRFLGKEHLPEIMALQEKVVRHLSRPDLLQPFSREFMETHLGAKGFVIGALVRGELVAFCGGYFPDVGDREWNLGYDLGLDDPDELRSVANLQIICIDPRHRGYGLGMLMCTAVIETIRGMSRFRHLCATISPYNYWSLNMALSCGLVVRDIKLKYGGKLRCIAYLDLMRTVALPEAGETIAVRLTDVARLEALLKQGYVGLRVRSVPGYRPATRLDHAEGYQLLFVKACPGSTEQ